MSSYLRKISLILIGSTDIQTPGAAPTGGTAIDLAEFRFRFMVSQADFESPNNARIRVYNLSPLTIAVIRKEYSRVVLQAGYEESFGVIFDGTIKQFGIGRENATDSYLDILAADGDQAYNFAVVNTSLEASATAKVDQLKTAVAAGKELGVVMGYFDENKLVGGTLPNPRGKVMFGMMRKQIRNLTNSVTASWSIQNGKINIVPLDGYIPGEPVVLSVNTGLIGVPEQTIDGVRCKCLLNPKIIPGQLVKIDNASVNQLMAANPKAGVFGNFPFDQRVGKPVLLADVAADGLYRVLVCEHEGDTRGQPWYSSLTCLKANPVTETVKPYG